MPNGATVFCRSDWPPEEWGPPWPINCQLGGATCRPVLLTEEGEPLGCRAEGTRAGEPHLWPRSLLTPPAGQKFKH